MLPSKRNYDVIIIGSGASGMTAAYEASHKGLSVLVIEKGHHIGGSGNYAGGIFAVGSYLQNKKYPEDNITPDFVLNEEMEYSHHRADAAAWRKYVDQSAFTIKWLHDLGVEYIDCIKINTGYRTFHLLKGQGKAAIDVLYKHAKENGAEVITSSKVIKLQQDLEGGVSGVLTKDLDNNKKINISAKSVIIATGGYLNSPEIMAKYTHYRADRVIPMNSGKNTGDGLKLAWNIGAQRYAMGSAQLFGGFLMDPTKPSYKYRYSELNAAAGQEGLLWVNQVGDRFTNEHCAANFAIAGNAIMTQNKVFAIIDQKTIDHLNDVGITMEPGTYTYKDPTFPHLRDEIKKAEEEKAPYFHKADSIEELAKEVNLPNLKKTVKRYNELCHKGHDDDFLKEPEFLFAVEKGPFYCLEQGDAAYCTMGGLNVNLDNVVLDEDGFPIKHLYAIGNDASGVLEGDTYGPNMPGTGLGYCFFSGRNAADVIANNLKK